MKRKSKLTIATAMAALAVLGVARGYEDWLFTRRISTH